MYIDGTCTCILLRPALGSSITSGCRPRLITAVVLFATLTSGSRCVRGCRDVGECCSVAVLKRKTLGTLTNRKARNSASKAIISRSNVDAFMGKKQSL